MRELIGTSTFMCMDQPFADTIAMVAEQGLGLECVPAFTGSLHGTPHGGRRHDPDLWRSVLAWYELADLKQRLAKIPFVTVHAAMAEKHARISSPDEGERRLAWERYADAIKFAKAIGARLVTFHAPLGGGGYEYRLDCRDRLIEFARWASDLAADSALMLGFEIFDYQLIDEIGRSNFGIHFDIGHAAKVLPGGPEQCTDHIMQLLQEAGDRVVQFHVHGVRWTGYKLADHVSFAFNDCIDFRRIVRYVKSKQINVPWVFELATQLASSRAVMAACAEARDSLVAYWNES